MNENLKKIVWIVSYPKSGNTWFRAFLSNLFSDSPEPTDINKLLSTPIASSRIQFDEYSGVSSSDMTFDEIDDHRYLVYKNIAENSNDIVFRKVHDAWCVSSKGDAIFPSEITKAVIYIIRNPLDIAVSFSFHSGKTLDETIRQLNNSASALCSKPNRLHNQLRQRLMGWSQHVTSWTETSGLPVHVMRYEDILADAYGEFNKALEFCGLKFDSDSIMRAIEYSEFKNLRKMEEDHGFKEKPIKMQEFFRFGDKGNWKTTLTNDMVNEIVNRNSLLMERYGYLIENQPI